MNRDTILKLGADELDTVHRASIAAMAVGALLAIAGVYALAYILTASVVAIFALGWLLLAGAIFHLVAALADRHRHTTAVNFLATILYGVAGVLTLYRPLAAAGAVTLVLGIMFLIQGLMRIFGAATGRHMQWGWMLFNGIITALLGAYVLYLWPLSSVWLPGVIIGVDMLLSGVAMVIGGAAVFRETRAMPPTAVHT